mmetsp:Transcript_4949/g.3559  ORF Transcript_4949/g.3559 Transcript_4949/m.3559 type:complete len:98 (+) Transcript_4949:843-1136(+)
MVLGNLVAMNYGATQIYSSEGFDPAAALTALDKCKGTGLYGVPTMFVACIEEYQKNRTKYDIKHLRKGICAGSVCPGPLMENTVKELGLTELHNAYG